MKTEIFAAEILLDSSRQITRLNEHQIKMHLAKLRSNYEEAFILTERYRVLFVVSGFSRMPLVEAILGIAPYAESLEIKTGTDSVSLVMGIARGMRWKGITSKEVRQMLSKAVNLSMESNCMGEVFSNLFLRALDENAKSFQSYEAMDNLIKKPVFATFDFQVYSLN